MEDEKNVSKFKEYLPLILVLSAILLLVAGWEFYQGRFMWQEAMRVFMGLFFVFFGLFKTLDWRGFVMAFAEYDVVAGKLRAYAWIYPVIEWGLGVLYLAGLYLFWVNLVTVVVMSVGSVGVIKSVMKKRKIRCACLGTVVKLPMSTVTIIEDVGMGLMALVMLFV